jgi:hypothetical protein
MINMAKLNELTDKFCASRNEFLDGLSDKERLFKAAEYDSELPMITQREQLILIGVNSKDVEHNLHEILTALELIGVVVLRKGVPDEHLVSVLERSLDDLVPCMWKCEGYQEVIDADPDGRFLSKGMKELKQAMFSGAVSLDSDVLSLFK